MLKEILTSALFEGFCRSFSRKYLKWVKLNVCGKNMCDNLSFPPCQIIFPLNDCRIFKTNLSPSRIICFLNDFRILKKNLSFSASWIIFSLNDYRILKTNLSFSPFRIICFFNDCRILKINLSFSPSRIILPVREWKVNYRGSFTVKLYDVMININNNQIYKMMATKHRLCSSSVLACLSH